MGHISLRSRTSSTLRTLIVIATLSLAAACGGQKAAEDPPPTHTTSPTVSTSTSAPVIPALATEHTEAGAKAFVVYFFHVADYSLSSLDTAPLEALVAPACDACRGAVEAIKAIGTKGGRSTGGKVTVSDLVAKKLSASTTQPMQVDFNVQSAPQLVTYPSAATESHPGGSSRLRFILSPTPGGWTVGYWGQGS